MDQVENINWTLKEMRALHYVIQLGTVTAAGSRMGLSQPAVSRILSGLETKLAKPLFERQGRTLVPTQWALDFYASSTRVFEAIESMHSYSLTTRKTVLRIVAPPTFSHGFLQEAIGEFLQEYVNVNVVLDVRSSPAIYELVSEGLADLGISDIPSDPGAVRELPFRQASMVCFMREDHPLTQYETVDLEKVDNLVIVGLSSRYATRSFIDRHLEEARVRTQMIAETSTATAAVSFVEKTGAVAFLSPFPVAAGLPSTVTYRPLLAGRSYITRFLLSRHVGVKPVTRQLMRFIMKIARKHDNWSEGIM